MGQRSEHSSGGSPSGAPDPGRSGESAAPVWMFLPADPPRAGRFLVVDPRSGEGLFATTRADVVDEQVGIEVAELSGGRVRRRPVTGRAHSIAEGVSLLLGEAGSASASARVWRSAIEAGLLVMARGAVVPAVTTGGWCAWQVDPIEPGESETLARLAAAIPPEAHAALRPGRSLRVDAPEPLIRALWDALADTLIRTAGAEVVAGTPLFTAESPTAAGVVADWVDAAYGHATTPFRVVLRVDLDDDGVFTVGALIRGTTDPALQVRFGAFGSTGANVLDLLGGEERVEPLVELMLQRGSAAWPPLASSFRTGERQRRRIDDQTLAELADAADALAAHGIDLEWPEAMRSGSRVRIIARLMPEAERRAAGVTAPAGERGTGGSPLALTRLLDFSWEVACGDLVLNESEVLALASGKRQVARIRDRWVRLDRATLDEVTRIVEELRHPPTLPEVIAGVRCGSGVLEGRWREIRMSGALRALCARLDPNAPRQEEPEPPGLRATLRPYQRQGLSWLLAIAELGLGGVLADDMGLGKTIQIIALHCRLAGAQGPTLVVCPASLVTNWQKEFARFAPEVPVLRLDGSTETACLGPEGLPADGVVVTTYGMVRRRAHDLATREWGLVVADEAQHIKNPQSLTHRSLRSIPGVARIAVTGTPIENRLLDLWALMEWANPGLLGPMAQYTAAAPQRVTAQHAMFSERLAHTVSPFLLRRRKVDPGIAPDLPPRVHRDVRVRMTREQLTLYQAVIDDHRARLGADDVSQAFVLSLLTSLKQVANHPAHYLHEEDGPLRGRSEKLEATVSLALDSVEGGEQVLIFSQYVEMCGLIARRLAEVGVSSEVLHGGLTLPRRDELVDRFQAGSLPVLIVSLKAGGTGLNLTAASQVVHFDRWWNPAVEDQATDRAWRLGQQRMVTVHRLLVEDTLEQRIAEVIESKRALAGTVVRGDDSVPWLGDLDSEWRIVSEMVGRMFDQGEGEGEEGEAA